MKKLLFLIIPIVVLVVALYPRNKLAVVRQSVFPNKDLRLVSNEEPARTPATVPEEEKVRSFADTDGANKQSIVVRKIIHSGEITLQIKHYEPFFQALQKQVDLTGGFIANIQSQRSGDSVSSATVTLRVPPAQLQMMISWLREQGLLTNEHIQAEDISEQYYDLKARLENAKRFESRLLEMLKTQTGKLQDLILVESKLNEVREQIEQMEGKVKYFDALTDLATLTVQVQVESVYIPPAPPTFAHRVAVAWRDSLHGLFETAQVAALIVVTIVPWIVPMMLVAILARFGWRSLRRSRGLKSAVNNAG